MKTPPDPGDVAEALRERIKKEDLTLTASEAAPHLSGCWSGCRKGAAKPIRWSARLPVSRV